MNYYSRFSQDIQMFIKMKGREIAEKVRKHHLIPLLKRILPNLCEYLINNKIGGSQ